eukprot:TRINITY_DN4176_c0_g2_i4.p1 TRINITY_DN4176_c0_g2~~TRINITY_DN4176_c0_g2_i4.p1  ORF type:complete len:191 (+),score=14.88 TRINITY_DN4176_c0_g2_i4:846-1418(+)
MIPTTGDLANFVLYLNLTPSFFYFVCYMVILFLWAEIFHSSQRPKNLKPLFFVLSSMMLILGAILIIADIIFGEQTDAIRICLYTLIGTVYALSALAFIYYGTRFYLAYRPDSSIKAVTLQKIRNLTLICGICFIIRCGLSFSNNSKVMSDFYINQEWWFDLVYWIGLEVIPIALMLLILRDRSKNSTIQ